MRSVELDDICKYRFISSPNLSSDGKTACFVVSQADKSKNEYKSCIYMRRDGKIRKLTSVGKERSFQFLDDNTLLFPGKRDGSKEPTTESKFYTISLDGGEAEEAYTFPVPVEQLIPMKNGDFIVIASVEPGWEKMYLGNKKYIADYLKHSKENEDYEEITQYPWYWNGSGFTKGGYSSIYRWDHKKKTLAHLVPDGRRCSNVKLSKDEKTIYYLGEEWKSYLTMGWEDKLYSLDLKTGEERILAEAAEKRALDGFELGDSFLLLIASNREYGLNTDGDFYKIDYQTGECSLYAEYGFGAYNAMCTDVIYGGGRQHKMIGDVFYFVTTRGESSYLYKLEDGVISPVVDREGSVDSFDIAGDTLLAVGMYDVRPEEVFVGTLGKPDRSDGNESGKTTTELRKISRFNDSAIAGKYIAVPERFDIERNTYDEAGTPSETGTKYKVKGFVMKPKDYDPSKKYPAVFDIHGGPKTAYGPLFFHEMQYWAGLGYFVFYCNPTGSDGKGNEFMYMGDKYGTVDFDDLMAFCDAVIEAFPAIDAGRLYETGGSYGGFMTNWIIGHTGRFRAAASQRSISNWFSFYGVSDIGIEFTKNEQGCSPWNDPERLWWHSPLKYADDVKTPTLFLHSFEDYRCPIDQGYQMYTALVERGIDTKMIAFKGENHELSRSGKPLHRIKRLDEITKWFQNH